MHPERSIGACLLLLGLACRPPAPVVPSATAPSAAPRATSASEREVDERLEADAKLEAQRARQTARDARLRARFGCDPEGPDYAKAKAELAALDPALANIGDLEDPAPLVQRIEAVLESPCLGLARLHAVPLRAESGLALRLWRERGGVEWLASGLAFAKGGTGEPSFPPTMPITLSLDTHPSHALAPWLCGLHDEACAATTAGWRARAQQVMGRNENVRFVVEQRRDARRCEASALEHAEYLSQLDEHDPGEPCTSWARCMFEAEGDDTEFPLGGLRAPEDGWLVIEGRRGHYQFCDELHAYELATGAAHVVRSCSGIVFDEHAGIDEQAVAAQRRGQVQRGAVPRDTVRELVFMLLVADHVRSPSIPKHTRPNAPLEIDWPDDTTGALGVSNVTEFGGSNQTELSWRYVPPKGPAIEGHFSWPPGYNRAPQRHAANLLSVVEAGIVPGCPPRPLPATLPLGPSLTGVSPIDASQDALDDGHQRLVTALRDQVRCKSSAR